MVNQHQILSYLVNICDNSFVITHSTTIVPGSSTVRALWEKHSGADTNLIWVWYLVQANILRVTIKK